MSRRDWLILAILCIAGLILRAWRGRELSIEHFDEGVYASNVYTQQLSPILGTDVYPSRHLYAPPLFPWLCETAIRVTGTPDGALLVNLLFGTLMIPLVWFAARDQLGSAAGLIAAALCATSDDHIFLSRSALTDVSLGFWLLLAVWLAARGLASGRKLELLGAGLAAGLAWWTKYNGWLAVLIPLSGAGCLWVMGWRGPREVACSSIRWKSWAPRWAILAGTAALLWIPVLMGLQSLGGYASVAANHQTYLVGPGGWVNGARLHLAFLSWIGFKASCGGVLGTALLLRDRAYLLPLLVLGVSLLLGVGTAMLVLSAFAVLGLVLQMHSRQETESRPPFFPAMLVVWWVGLSLTTPLYRPYARLSLPWVISCWFLISIGIEQLSRRTGTGLQPWGKLGAIVAAVACLSWLAGPFTAGARPGARTGMRQVVGAIVHEIDMARESMRPSDAPGYDAAVYVVGEPALYCHLSHQVGDRLVIVPGPNMGVAKPIGGTYLPKFIVTGGHVPQTEIEQALGAHVIEPVWEQKILVSEMVALDSASRSDLQSRTPTPRSAELHTMLLRVFKIRD